MEQVSNDDFDFLFLQMKKMLEQDKTNMLHTDETDPGLGFHIRVPEELKKADEDQAKSVYWSSNRPSVIFLTEDKNAGITFQELADTQKGADPLACLEEIKQILERIDDRTVFYHTGMEEGNLKIYWMEYKSFAAKSRIYNLTFLFQSGTKTILGTFYCLFKDYDLWKPMILEMMRSIRTEEVTYEGL